MIDEEELKKALVKANSFITEGPDGAEHEFSPRTTRKIKRIIWREKHPVAYSLKYAAAASIALLFLGSILFLGTNKTVRANVFAWLSDTFEGTFLYRGTTDNHTDISHYSIRDIVPEGYEYSAGSSYDRSDERCETYIDPDDYYLFLMIFETKSEKTVQMLSDEGDLVQRVDLGDFEADLYYDVTGDSHAYVWQNENGTLFYLGGHIDLSTLDELTAAFLDKYD